jgi:hypothetical protein
MGSSRQPQPNPPLHGLHESPSILHPSASLLWNSPPERSVSRAAQRNDHPLQARGISFRSTGISCRIPAPPDRDIRQKVIFFIFSLRLAATCARLDESVQTNGRSRECGGTINPFRLPICKGYSRVGKVVPDLGRGVSWSTHLPVKTRNVPSPSPGGRRLPLTKRLGILKRASQLLKEEI